MKIQTITKWKCPFFSHLLGHFPTLCCGALSFLKGAAAFSRICWSFPRDSPPFVKLSKSLNACPHVRRLFSHEISAGRLCVASAFSALVSCHFAFALQNAIEVPRLTLFSRAGGGDLPGAIQMASSC
ncbi:hypothetical protein TRVL_09811 [Trypanosoma vivax]|nr:hypothetical protein TRVL_09811 [Trypanosoma vivax]